MPTYKNISNQTKYVLGRFVQPGETIATEQIITDSDFEKISDDPLYVPSVPIDVQLQAGVAVQVSLTNEQIEQYNKARFEVPDDVTGTVTIALNNESNVVIELHPRAGANCVVFDLQHSVETLFFKSDSTADAVLHLIKE